MTVPRGNGRISSNVGRIRSNVPLRPTFVDDETWYCGTAIAVPYVKLHKVFDVTGSCRRCIELPFFAYSGTKCAPSPYVSLK